MAFNFIPSGHDSIVIIGLRSVTYTFGLRFTYKQRLRFYKKSVFLFSWAITPILFVGSQSVLIEVCIIWYHSTGSKISFLSLYLLFHVIILSCSFCVFYSSFFFFRRTRLKSCTKVKKNKIV